MADYPSSLPTFDAPGAELADPEHSGLHEATDAELLAALTELGLTPSGTWSTVKARLDDVDQRLPLAIQSGVGSITTNGSGIYTFTFPEAFSSAPVVPLPSIGTTSVYYASVTTVTATTFTGTVRTITDGATQNSATFNVFRWVAIGTLA